MWLRHGVHLGLSMADMTKEQARDLIAWARGIADEQPKVASVLADVDRAIDGWRRSKVATKQLHLGAIHRHVGRLVALQTPQLVD